MENNVKVRVNFSLLSTLGIGAIGYVIGKGAGIYKGYQLCKKINEESEENKQKVKETFNKKFGNVVDA